MILLIVFSAKKAVHCVRGHGAKHTFLCLLWNLNVCYCVQKSLPGPVPHKSSTHPHTLFLTIYFNIILPAIPRFSEWLRSLRLSNQNFLHFSYFPYACLTHLILYFVILIIVCTVKKEGSVFWLNVLQSGPLSQQNLSGYVSVLFWNI